MQLTVEQYEALKLFHSGGNLVVNAFAGTGKTTTAIAVAESISSTGLYLAFNRSIAYEIKTRYTGRNLDCRATHFLAYRYIRANKNYTDDKLFQDLPLKFIVDQAGLKDFDIDNKIGLKAISFSFPIRETIRTFCNSGSDQILIDHVPKYGLLATLPKRTFEEFKKYVVSVAEFIWNEMKSENSEYPLGHDGYLKLWSLAAPALPDEFVLLDEAQDTNDAVLSVMRKRAERIVYIGDRYQQIYGWRDAVNAMSKITDTNYAFLTQSFRFAESIVSLANHILDRFGESEKLEGNLRIRTSINELETETKVCRTNAGVLSSAVGCLSENKKVHVLGGVLDLRRLLDDVSYLKNGRPATNVEFFGFQNWREVCEFADSEDGKHLQSLVKVISTFGEDKLKQSLDSCVADESAAQVVITTAHKSKGREWGSTEISSDFLSGWLRKPGKIDGEELKEEAQLLYAAITRCKKNPNIPQELLALIRRESSNSPIGSSSSSVAQKSDDSRTKPPPPPFIRER